MRLLFLLCLEVTAAYSQPFSFGVKGGVPLMDFVNTTQNSFPISAISNTNRYIVGPTVEFHLPAGLAVEFDALFRHYNYQATTRGVDTLSSTSATSNARARFAKTAGIPHVMASNPRW